MFELEKAFVPFDVVALTRRVKERDKVLDILDKRKSAQV
jgi:hypothetical protein